MSQHGTDYRCDTCGKIRGYLSESWSTVTTLRQSGEQAGTYHFCGECRSVKLVAS